MTDIFVRRKITTRWISYTLVVSVLILKERLIIQFCEEMPKLLWSTPAQLTLLDPDDGDVSRYYYFPCLTIAVSGQALPSISSDPIQQFQTDFSHRQVHVHTLIDPYFK